MESRSVRGERRSNGECTWTGEPQDRGVLAELETRTLAVRWRGEDRTVVSALFSRSGFRKELETAATERDDLFLTTPGDVLAVFRG